MNVNKKKISEFFIKLLKHKYVQYLQVLPIDRNIIQTYVPPTCPP